jgi:soluble lytic murein transglycosylase-like protein
MAETHNISEHLIHAIISVESAYNPQALSRAGAQGLMQLMPATARRFGVRDSFDPVDNIRGGTTYFKELLRMFNGDLQLSLAAYNAGENAVKRYNNRIPPFKETQDYVKKVMLRYDQYRIASR